MEWTREKVREYKTALNRRVAELVGTGEYSTPDHTLYHAGVDARNELLTPEEQASLQEWQEQHFLEGLRTIKDRHVS